MNIGEFTLLTGSGEGGGPTATFTLKSGGSINKDAGTSGGDGSGGTATWFPGDF